MRIISRINDIQVPGFGKERSHNAETGITGGLEIHCHRGIRCCLLPLVATRSKVGPEKQEVCAGGLLHDRRSQRFVQHLLCVGKLPLAHEESIDVSQRRQRLRTLISSSFAPNASAM